MATIKISEELIADLLFGGAVVHIRDAAIVSRGVLELTIDGPTVPETDHVTYTSHGAIAHFEACL